MRITNIIQISTVAFILLFGLPAGRNPLVGAGPAHADTAVLVKTIVGPDTVTFFGNSIAVGDFNGDNSSDMIIGASDLSGSIGSPGWAYMYYGGSAFDSLWDVQYRGVQGRVGDWTGYGKAVSSAGDFDGDGYDDIVIGSPHYDDSLSSTGDDGRIYLYKGGLTPDTIPLWCLDSPHGDGAEFGYSAASIGDINKDGCSDIIVGSPVDFRGFTMSGAAYILLGDSTNPDSGIDYELWGLRNSERFGCSVAGCDLNGDGWKDVLVGAQGIETIPVDTTILGRVYVFLGGASFDTTCDLYYQGRQKGAHFGRSISHGDFNNDGYEDVIVGEYGYNSNTGRAYIYLGGAIPDTVPDLIVNGEQAGSRFGYNVCGAGDLNGDSVDDWLVSAHRYQNGFDSLAGRIYVYYGGAILNSVPGVIITGIKKNSLGGVLTRLNDINNDGKKEFSAFCNLERRMDGGDTLGVLIYNIGVNGVANQSVDENNSKDIYLKCYPNPFSKSAVFTYQVPRDSDIKLSVYNIAGQLVKTIEKGFKKAGNYKIEWNGIGNNGEKLANGIYFYKLNINNQTITKKLILLK